VIRVLIAEDHPLYRDALVNALADDPDVDVVGAVGTGGAAVAEAARTCADVIVMDLEMPGGSGLGATAAILATGSGARVLVLTSHEDDRNVYAALRAGAHGYLMKSASAEQILAAVAAVARGDGMFSGTVVDRITRHVTTGGRSGASGAFPELTSRERDVLELMARGHSNTFIADHFVLSLKTVSNHVTNLMTKMGVENRSAAVAKARDGGLGQRKE
jgi:DNA-binding NarL/FixJ family response regulator